MGNLSESIRGVLVASRRISHALKRSNQLGVLILKSCIVCVLAVGLALFDQLGQHVSWLGVNSHGAVIVASLGGMALHIWTIKGYFESIDASLEEAAIVDGATTWQAFLAGRMTPSAPAALAAASSTEA